LSLFALALLQASLFGDVIAPRSAPPIKKRRVSNENGITRFKPSKASPRRSVALPALDRAFVEKLRAEDKVDTTKRLRIGLGRSLPASIELSSKSISPFEWLLESDGTLSCSVAVSSEGASGLRIHLEDLRLPPGAHVLVHPPGSTNELAPLKPDSNATDVWTASVFASTAIIEVRVPANAATSEAHFVIRELSHIYRSLKQLSDPLTDCIPQIACYPTWLDAASGIALIDFIDSGTEYLCTGCLLTDTDPTSDFDYFLTAHHCIHNQAIASTMEAFWFYQASTCGGDPPDIDFVPETPDGAVLLSTSSRTDFAFLRLRNQAPDGATFLGWSTAAPSRFEPLICIQHPDAGDKRISFGHYTDASVTDFWGIQWTNGVTEEGSSGSPLMLSDGSVIGQLYGGTSECDNPEGEDIFGRFDGTYPLIKKWIDSGSFVAKQGVYQGIFFEAGNSSFESSGFVAFKLTETGSYSGTVQMAGKRYSFKGEATDWSITLTNSSTTTTVSRGNSAAPLTLTLAIDFAPGATDLIGTVSDGGWAAQLQVNEVAFNAKTNPSPVLGNFTLALPPNFDDPSQPQGYSYATISVNTGGSAKLIGSLADGAAFTETAGISDSADFPVYASLYGGKGCLVGWLNLTNGPAAGPSGNLTWIKKPQTAKLYSSGFTNDTAAIGSPYDKPGGGESPVQPGAALVVFAGSGLTPPQTNSITISSSGKVINQGPNRLAISFNRGNGLFSGSATLDNIAKPVPVKGALLQQSDDAGFGYFIGNSLSGSVSIVPQ
jgi:hypothetical protein